MVQAVRLTISVRELDVQFVVVQRGNTQQIKYGVILAFTIHNLFLNLSDGRQPLGSLLVKQFHHSLIDVRNIEEPDVPSGNDVWIMSFPVLKESTQHAAFIRKHVAFHTR